MAKSIKKALQSVEYSDFSSFMNIRFMTNNKTFCSLSSKNMAYLSDRCGQERGRVGEEDFFAARDIPRCHDRHSPLSVKVLSRIGHARMVDVAVEVNTYFTLI